MSIGYGSPGTSTNVNAKLMSRTSDTDTIGKLDLKNDDVASGSHTTNVQKILNGAASFVGYLTSQAYNALPTWASDIVGAANDTVKARIEAIQARFLAHTHNGAANDGGAIDVGDLININQFFAAYQSLTVTATTGTSDDVSALFAAKTSGGNSTTAGVITSAPDNRIDFVDDSTGEVIEDGSGRRVYARITEAAGVWTLSYYVNIAGVETAHSMSSTDILIFYREVFTQATRPTIGADVGQIGSLNLTADILDASTTQSGKVNTTFQSFAGIKTFTDGIDLQEVLKLGVVDEPTTGSNVTLPAPDEPVVRLTGTITDLDGIDATIADSNIVYLVNDSGADITINHDAATTDGFFTGGDPFTFKIETIVACYYDNTFQRWLLLGGAGSGGGGTRKIVPHVTNDVTNGAEFIVGGASWVSNQLPVHRFYDDNSNKLLLIGKIDADYITGIALSLKFHANVSSAGTKEFEARTTLYNASGDTQTFTTSVSPIDGAPPAELEIAITDGSGLVNGVAPVPGNLFAILLTMNNNGTSTGDLDIVNGSYEVVNA